MRNLIICSLSAVVLLPALTGCNTQSLKDENALLVEENSTLRAQLEDRNQALDSVNQELRDKNLANSDLQRQLTDVENEPVGGTGFENIPGVTPSSSGGEIVASVESDVLFDSGKSTLKPAAKQTLDAVAGVLSGSYGTKTVRVAGHTDSDPIKKSGYKSNYHLGFERAVAVRNYLASRGVKDARMYLASYGPNRPRTTKDASRRVEIVVLMN
jgi:outer membrane protein OmpA-like peptidoglycan-associated protein